MRRRHGNTWESIHHRVTYNRCRCARKLASPEGQSTAKSGFLSSPTLAFPAAAHRPAVPLLPLGIRPIPSQAGSRCASGGREGLRLLAALGWWGRASVVSPFSLLCFGHRLIRINFKSGIHVTINRKACLVRHRGCGWR